MSPDDPRAEIPADDLGVDDAALLDRLQAMWQDADPMPSGLVERV